MEQAELQQLRRLKNDFEHYASSCLKIADKNGKKSPFVLNRAQKYVHERLEEQLFETGHIRALILKGRQQGISTYAEGRFYWRTSLNTGCRAFILTHLAEATDNLFSMVERYHQNVPDPLRPSTSTDSRKELKFDKLDSGYKVSTAGSKGTGRSATFRYFHGSEIAFWPNSDTHAAGALQTVGRGNGSEVIFESTANGMQGYFFEKWQQAEGGIGEFIAVFVPWFWQAEYVADPPDKWQPEDEEAQAAEWYGLTLEQSYWYYLKNLELGGNPGVICTLLKQEYPCTAAEAFQVTGRDTLIGAEEIMSARKVVVEDPHGARVLGVDPARFGDDRSSLIDRRGRKASNLVSLNNQKVTELANKVAIRIEEAKEEGDPYLGVYVDEVGLGAGVVDILDDWGYDDIVIPVNAGSSSSNPDIYFNKRVEMWVEMAEWLKSDRPVQIPDSDSLHADLMAPGYTHNMRQQKVLQTKEQMRKEGIRSPDEAEALALTFAYPINTDQTRQSGYRKRQTDWRTT